MQIPRRDRSNLGSAPSSWRGFIPTRFPSGSRLLHSILLFLGVAYFLGVVALTQTHSAASERRRAILERPREHVTVSARSVDGDDSDCAVMRWVFLGRVDEVAPCLVEGEAIQVRAKFSERRLVIDAPDRPCLQKALAPVGVSRSMHASCNITLTKFWYSPGL